MFVPDDPLVAAHLAGALAAWRAGRGDVPQQLVWLEGACRNRVVGGQNGPRSAVVVASSENGDGRVLLKVERVAEELQVSVSTAKRLLARGDIRSVKVGGARRVRRDDLNEYVRSLGGTQAG